MSKIIYTDGIFRYFEHGFIVPRQDSEETIEMVIPWKDIEVVTAYKMRLPPDQIIASLQISAAGGQIVLLNEAQAGWNYFNQQLTKMLSITWDNETLEPSMHFFQSKKQVIYRKYPKP